MASTMSSLCDGRPPGAVPMRDDARRDRGAPSSAGTHAPSSSSGAQPHAPRIVVRPGYSQMDWLRRATRERVDGGAPSDAPVDVKRVIDAGELARHNTRDDCWIGLRGKVYNLTPYVAYHPGGEAVLEEAFGTDATALFDKYHKYVNGEYIMRATRVGVMPGHVDDSDSE